VKGELSQFSTYSLVLVADVSYSFGWVNASYVVGLHIINAHMRRALGTLTTWDVFHKATQDNDVYTNGTAALDDAPESSRDIAHMEHEAKQDRDTYDHLQEAYIGMPVARPAHGMMHLHQSRAAKRHSPAAIAAYP